MAVQLQLRPIKEFGKSPVLHEANFQGWAYSRNVLLEWFL